MSAVKTISKDFISFNILKQEGFREFLEEVLKFGKKCGVFKIGDVLSSET